jgi:hypothetical protein
MLKTLSAALACAALAVLAGCGGSDDNASSTPKADPAQQAQQDAQAKSDARNLEVQLEVCFTDNGSYKPCALAEDGTVDGQDTGLGDAATSGELTTETSADGYVVTAKSESGNAFTIEKAGGGPTKRTCTTKGAGGCPASGSW